MENLAETIKGLTIEQLKELAIKLQGSDLTLCHKKQPIVLDGGGDTPCPVGYYKDSSGACVLDVGN